MLEAIRSLHRSLDLRVQSFHNTIRYPRERKTDHPTPISFDRLSHLDDRLQPTVCCPKIPSLQIMGSINRIFQFPKPRKRQFDVVRLLSCQVLRILKPKIADPMKKFMFDLLVCRFRLNCAAFIVLARVVLRRLFFIHTSVNPPDWPMQLLRIGNIQ